MMTAYQIRENIRRLREFRNFNQEDIAEKLNLSPRAYANIENGRAGLDIDRLVQISGILKISLINLLTLHLNNQEDVADYLKEDSQKVVFKPGANSENRESINDEHLLPELMKQIEFLRQAYADIQQDKSLLRAEIQELRSAGLLQTN
ncbi:MAG TPA: helix-turn-helix transcriptional regulator [Saprospiraceae bacterium]|nr:helix-turn-helix transcriptional regulator [Saprospiraceae bacterium]